MADHWKSLADLLGAPGMDPPEEPTREETAAAGAVEQNEGGDDPQSSEALSDTEAVVETLAADTASATDDSTEIDHQADMDAAQSTDSAVEANSPEPANVDPELAELSFKFDHPDAVQDTNEQPEAADSNDAAADDQPEVIQAVRPKAARPAKKQQDVEAKADKKKSKKRSSWDSLSSMFNLPFGSNRSASAESEEDDTAEDESTLNAELGGPSAGADEDVAESAGETPTLSIFDDADAADDANPALEAMFGDTPRADGDAWQRPKRVVDDVGWGDDDDPPKAEEEVDEAYAGSDEISDEFLSFKTPAPKPAREEKAERDGGRRRRKPRRPKDKPRSEEQPSGRDAADDWGKDSPQAASDDWDEPRSFAADDETEEAERRSSRRRRRGRRPEAPARDEDVEVAAADDGLGEERPKRARRRPERDAEKGEQRRRKREQPDRQRKRPDNDVRDDVDVDDDDNEVDGRKHRNIPTWQDALNSIVESNISNHRKNEGRGGRGRSRGRRS